MLTLDELDLRREVIAGAPDLRALAGRLAARVGMVLDGRPAIPALKGMLTADGGVCPADGTALRFDPWSPSSHLCPSCGQRFQGERHDRRWAWHQHLWLAERLAEAAAVGILMGDDEAVGWAAETVAAYADRYFELPNADNVLGPTRLFSSTYLESVWLTSYLAAAFMLREAGALGEAGEGAVSRVAEEAVNLIGEFDERLSNRQTWHNAALAAAAVWFGDEDLAQRAIEGPRGLVGHLVDGFRPDGLWYEGENYHLFALRGLLTGAGWARQAGVDFFAEPASRARLVAALRAPALTALPDGTFPARKDSRFGVSLAQPMYLELWEAGIAGLYSGDDEADAVDLANWLRQLYAGAAPPAETFDSYLHEAGEAPPQERGRSDLSWWMLCGMLPELPGTPAPWQPGSVLLEDQGLAILRGAERYASVECGLYGGGHGHADRLHLTLFAGGRHWLADPGTGSYVSRSLFWYRSTLAHNAPRVDGRSQPEADARAEMFDQKGEWGWVRGRFQGLTRTVVCGNDHLVDVVEFAGEQEHLVELPWHPAGQVAVLSAGTWEPATVDDPFATGAERFVPAVPGRVQVRATLQDHTLDLWLVGGSELVRARAPGPPGESGDRPFLICRAAGRYVRFVTVLRFGAVEVTGVKVAASEITVETAAGVVTHRQTSDGWEVDAGGSSTALRGVRRGTGGITLDVPVPGMEVFKYTPPVATAYHLAAPPALDGSPAGFVTDAPLALDHEDQYRRSEEPYPGPDVFSATAWLGWDEKALYVAVDVVHQPPVFPAADAPPRRLDNEPDLIHADGVQLYLELPDRPGLAWLVVPDPAGSALQVRGAAGTPADAAMVTGRWHRTPGGYGLTLAITPPGWPPVRTDGDIRLDLLVNEMRPGRLRRAGQLVWTGGGGWIYLRGDRQASSRFGRLELA